MPSRDKPGHDDGNVMPEKVDMADVFGRHRPKIPYQPIAELLARYARREPDKPAIVDLDQNTSISYGALERAVTDIAAALKQRGMGKGSRVLLLADETLEKLLIWLAVWRLAAVVAVLNVELNAKLIADLAAVVDPALALVHKELDGDVLLAGRPFVRFGRYSESAADADPARMISSAPWRAASRPRACRSATRPPISPASSAPPAPPAGRNWSSMTIAPIGSTDSPGWRRSDYPSTTARSNTARSAGTRRRW